MSEGYTVPLSVQWKIDQLAGHNLDNLTNQIFCALYSSHIYPPTFETVVLAELKRQKAVSVSLAPPVVELLAVSQVLVKVPSKSR